jgi:hypothetical protein
MSRTNKDVEQFHQSRRSIFDDSNEDRIVELFDECKGDSSSKKSTAYGDHGQKWKEWLWCPKKMIASGEIVVRELSNGFEITMPRWFAERNDLI